MLVSLALIAVPLLIAILTAVIQIRNLADRGQKIVIQGVAGARASQALFGEIANLERTARLYEVLGQPGDLESYRIIDERLSVTREQLSMHAAPDTAKTLEDLGSLQQRIRLTIMSTPPSSEPSRSSLR